MTRSVLKRDDFRSSCSRSVFSINFMTFPLASLSSLSSLRALADRFAERPFAGCFDSAQGHIDPSAGITGRSVRKAWSCPAASGCPPGPVAARCFMTARMGGIVAICEALFPNSATGTAF